MTKGMRFFSAAAALLMLSACTPPKYVSYASIHGDWRCRVPWGWNVITDEEDGRYFATNFIGPFEPDFYLGVPSFSVRWYARSVPHRLRNGLIEIYGGPDDYIKQMLEGVYGPKPFMKQPVHDILLGDGRKAKHFVVLSPVAVPASTRWGTAREEGTGRLVNLRQHAYVVVGTERGFYVLVYPATREGFKLYEPQFNELVNSFQPLADGPGGPKLVAARARGTP